MAAFDMAGRDFNLPPANDLEHPNEVPPEDIGPASQMSAIVIELAINDRKVKWSV